MDFRECLYDMGKRTIKIVSTTNEDGQEEIFAEMHSSFGDYWRVNVTEDPIMIMQITQKTYNILNIREYIKKNGKHFHKDGTPFKNTTNFKK